MKSKKSEAEYANKKIDEFFNGKRATENVNLDIDPYLANNNISLVVNGLDKETDK